MKKFVNLKTVISFLLGAILFSGISAYAQNIKNGVYVESQSIDFYDNNKYSAGIYCDPNTGNFVFSSRQQRNTEINSTNDIFLNADGSVYLGYVKSKDNQVITYAELTAEMKKLQKQIDLLKND